MIRRARRTLYGGKNEKPKLKQAREDKNANSPLAILLYTYFYTKYKFCIKKGIEKALKWAVSAFLFVLGFPLDKIGFLLYTTNEPEFGFP